MSDNFFIDKYIISFGISEVECQKQQEFCLEASRSVWVLFKVELEEQNNSESSDNLTSGMSDFKAVFIVYIWLS